MADRGPPKRRKVEVVTASRSTTPMTSLNRDISPPVRTKLAATVIKVDDDDASEHSKWLHHSIMSSATAFEQSCTEMNETIVISSTESSTEDEEIDEAKRTSMNREKVASTSRSLPSPIQLTRIQNLPSSHNVNAVSLRDLIGDPMIKECWQFNYLLDLDFIM